jgi:hypothetical protein
VSACCRADIYVPFHLPRDPAPAAATETLETQASADHPGADRAGRDLFYWVALIPMIRQAEDASWARALGGIIDAGGASAHPERCEDPHLPIGHRESLAVAGPVLQPHLGNGALISGHPLSARRTADLAGAHGLGLGLGSKVRQIRSVN